jgi:hypothetical protein
MRLMLICGLALLGLGCGRKSQTPERAHWTVTVGEQSREQLFERLNKLPISNQNEPESFTLLVRDSPEFQISPTKEKLDLVVVTAEELGLPIAQWAPLIPFEEFKTKVAQAGYKLCPHDAAALLLVAIRAYEPLEFTYIAMERITGMREKQPVMRPLIPVVFTYLGTTYAVMRPLDLVYGAPRRYIVARPRKG